MMDAYLTYSGIVANIVAGLLLMLCLWVWFIWPAVEAISITRYELADCKLKGIRGITARQILWSFIHQYRELIFGRHWSQLTCRNGYWRGVGNWKVQGGDNHE